MKIEQLKPWLRHAVTVTLTDGSKYRGSFSDTPEVGLYHVIPTPSRPGVVERFGPLVDLYAEDILKIEPVL